MSSSSKELDNLQVPSEETAPDTMCSLSKELDDLPITSGKTASDTMCSSLKELDDIPIPSEETASDTMPSSPEELDDLPIPLEKTAFDTMSFSRKELDDKEIPLEKIASATDNFADKNLIYKDAYFKVYKGKLTGCGQLGNIVVQRRIDNCVYQQMEDELWKDLFQFSTGSQSELSVIGFSGDKNIIIYEHVGNGSLEKDVSDPTFNWMQRLKICNDLAQRSISSTWGSDLDRRLYIEMVYMICLGDLMFLVLCERKGEEHVTLMAIKHYEKQELKKIIQPHLTLQMHQQSLTIFSNTAYDCIVKQPRVDFSNIRKELGKALELQAIQNKFHDLEIPFGEIASATNNFGDQNLIYKEKHINVYKGKLLGSGQLGNIVVQRRLDDRVSGQQRKQLWKDLLNISAGSQNELSVVGFSGDKNIIIYEHVGNESLNKDVSNPTFTWMQRLQMCDQLAWRSISTTWGSAFSRRTYFEMVYMISLGDLMFEVLCEKKGEEHVTPMAIEHYEKRELEKIIHPHLRLQMDQQSVTIFSNTAYDCIVKQPHVDYLNIRKELGKALELQAIQEISSTNNNFADKNLIYKGAFVNVYKEKLLGSGKLGNIIVQRMIDNRVYEQWEDELWKDLLNFSAGSRSQLCVLGFSGDKNIIIYEHVGNESLEKDVSDPTFTWMQRLQICHELAWNSLSMSLGLGFDRRPYFEMVYMICLSDLMFEVLCEKKGEEHVSLTAIEHHEKGELEKIIHPHLREQMHQQSFTIFSNTAYDCMVSQPLVDIVDIRKGLKKAVQLQAKHERNKKFDDLKIPFEGIASATNNFGDQNLMYKDEHINVYKGKVLLGSGQLGNIVVHGRFDNWIELLENFDLDISVVGVCADKSIIVYEHLGNKKLEKDVSDPTFNWMQRLQTCLNLANDFWRGNLRSYSRCVFSLCMGDLMFQVLCEKQKTKQDRATLRMGIEHYEKGELEKLIHPNLRVQMHDQSLTIFLDTAYACIKRSINIGAIPQQLQKAWKLQTEHEKYKKFDDLKIPFEEIASATNNFGDQNLMYKDENISVYKGKVLLGSGQLGNIVVQGRFDNWMEFLETFDLDVSIVGVYADKSIIVYEHLGNQKLEKDVGDPTFDWMQRLQTCMDLANTWRSRVQKSYFEYVFSLCLGDLMFQVLCEKKKVEQDVATLRLAIEHYEKGELKKLIHPNLRVQMHHQSLTIFLDTAYACIKRSINIGAITQQLRKAWKLQTDHEKYLECSRIKIADIRLSTNNFANEHFVGSGTYGTVYKAELDYFDRKSGSVKRGIVAIKSISNEDGQGDQGFYTELDMLCSCRHCNIISLLGFCHEDSMRILVYEYAFKQSLSDYLGSTNDKIILCWAKRLQICLDIAHGLEYLHNNTEDKPKIIHRDIKSDNILLGEDWSAKIGDFGLSKFHPMNQEASTIKTKIVAGTPFYVDPEYERTGHLKKESDIYSFGVVLLEILSGRLAYDQIYLAENYNGLPAIARRRFSKGTLNDMVDPQLKEADQFISTLYYGPNQDSLNTFSEIAHRCLAETQIERPTIEAVIEELQKALNFEENRRDILTKFSFKDIDLGTENFCVDNCIIRGAFRTAYNGKVQCHNELMDVVAMRLHRFSQEDAFSLETTKDDFLRQHAILMKHKHGNIIDLVGYCREGNEKIIVYGLASVGTLEMHLSNATLGWVERLKISIDVASALEFLHESVQVIHGDYKSASILLNADWRARIFEFGVCLPAPLNKKIKDYDINYVSSTHGYSYPLLGAMDFLTKEIDFSPPVVLTRESDIYSLGVVLFEMMCGCSKWEYLNKKGQFLDGSVKISFEKERLDEIVFEDLKQEMVPHSLATFQMIVYQCLDHKGQKQPTAAEVVLQLKKALEFQLEPSSVRGIGSYSPEERVPKFVGGRGNNKGVGHGDPHADCSENKAASCQARPDDISIGPELGHDGEGLEGDLEAQREAKRAQTVELEERTVAKRARTAELEERILDERARTIELEARMEAERARNTELEERMQAERARTIELEARMEAEGARNAELEARMEAEGARNAELEERMQAELARTTEVEERLEARNVELEERTVAERDRTIELEETIVAERARIAELEERILNLEAKREAKV